MALQRHAHSDSLTCNLTKAMEFITNTYKITPMHQVVIAYSDVMLRRVAAACS